MDIYVQFRQFQIKNDNDINWFLLDKGKAGVYIVTESEIPCRCNIQAFSDGNESKTIVSCYVTIKRLEIELTELANFIDINYDDKTIFLTDDAYEFYKDMLKHFQLSNFKKLTDEIDIYDIDTEKITSLLPDIIDGRLEGENTLSRKFNDRTYICTITGDGYFSSLLANCWVEIDQTINDYLKMAVTNGNYEYRVMCGEETVRTFDNLKDARDYIQDYLFNMLEEGKENEVEWSDWKVSAYRWDIASPDSNIQYTKVVDKIYDPYYDMTFQPYIIKYIDRNWSGEYEN